MVSGSTSVVIIGGGLSGTLAAIHLLRSTAGQNVSITLLNPTPAFGRGLAYGSADDHLLLNVPAGSMSAFADQPSHFTAFCQRIDASISATTFMPRHLYGCYLEHCLSEAMAAYPGRLHLMVGEAHGVHPVADGGGFMIQLLSGQYLASTHVVLALGHQRSRFPLPLGPVEHASVIEAWDFERMSRLPSGVPLLILGTGHTAVDVLFHLKRRVHPSTVWMASRRGLVPKAHRLNVVPPSASAYPAYLCEPSLRTRTLVRQVRQEVVRAAQEGCDWRDKLNQLRAHTPRLWQALPLIERQRFLRHVAAFWDIHRHRLAPSAAEQLGALIKAGAVHVLAARLLEVKNTSEDRQAVKLKLRNQTSMRTLNVAAVINCTGSSTRIGPDSQPLLKQLVKDGLVVTDPCDLGLQVNDRLQVINAEGSVVQGLWYVGPMLKARDWEATAAPELRAHAQRLAEDLATAIINCSKSSLKLDIA